MIRRRRGGPGEADVRLARAEELQGREPVAAEPLALAAALLRHHRVRAAEDLVRSEAALLAAAVESNRAAGRFPRTHTMRLVRPPSIVTVSPVM